MVHLFGNRLKELRKEKKITQLELANMLGVTFSTISAWEVGKAQPSYDILIKLATYFGVTVDYLLGFNQEDKDTLKRLKTALKEAGMWDDNLNDMSKEDFEKAIKIINMIKQKDTDNK